MNSKCWEILGINPTDNKSEIKKAYAALVKQNPPEKDAKKYQAIREAYNQALKYASIENSEQNELKNHSRQDLMGSKEIHIDAKPEEKSEHEEQPINERKPDEQEEDILYKREEFVATEELAKIRSIRDDVLNNASEARRRHEAIRKERGIFRVLAIIFVPISVILLFLCCKNHGGKISLIFNLLAGFIIASISTKIERALNQREEKKELQKVNIDKTHGAEDAVTVMLVFRLLLSLILCLALKVIFLATKCPDYMHHYFGGVMFFYFTYNLAYLKKQLKKFFQ
ncbi:MAG: hypothetical protein MJZ50_02165 [Treponema sp.]|nr:hypothetical protein [Treponema sp.]